MIKYASLANCVTFSHQSPLFIIKVQCKQQIWCVCVRVVKDRFFGDEEGERLSWKVRGGWEEASVAALLANMFDSLAYGTN